MDLLPKTLEMLKQTPLTRQQISSGTGIPLGTLNKIAMGFTPNPTVGNVQRIHNFLAAQQDQAA